MRRLLLLSVSITALAAYPIPMGYKRHSDASGYPYVINYVWDWRSDR